MAYHAHKIPGMDDSYNGHDASDPIGGYNSSMGYNSKDEFDPTKGYNGADEKYKDDAFSKDYISREQEEEKQKDEGSFGIEKELVDVSEKYRDGSTDEDAIFLKAAQEIHDSVSIENTFTREKAAMSNIDDAIEVAIRKEKEVVFLQR